MPTVSSPTDRRPSGKRTLLFGCGGLLALLILILMGYLSWANQLPPPEVDNRVLPQPNGFDAVNAVVGTFPTLAANSPASNPRTAEVSSLRPVVAQDRKRVRELRAALKLDYMVPPVGDFSAVFPYLAQYREASRRLAAGARVALEDGDAADSAAYALDAVDLGSKTGRGGTLIHHLVGIACSAIGSAALEPAIPRLSADEARAAGRRLDGAVARFPDAAEALREERKLGLASIRSMFRSRMTPAAAAGNTGPPGALSALMDFYPKPWTYAEMDRGYKAQIAEAEKPYPDRRPVPPPTEPYSAVLMPVLADAGFAFTKNETTLRLLRLELALQEFHQRHRRYPARLEELVPKTIAALPQDPFTGKPFVYRRRGADYLLYSVGPDFRDDGGQSVIAGGLKPGARGDVVARQLFTRPPLK